MRSSTGSGPVARISPSNRNPEREPEKTVLSLPPASTARVSTSIPSATRPVHGAWMDRLRRASGLRAC